MFRDQTVICLTTHALIVIQTAGRRPPLFRELLKETDYLLTYLLTYLLIYLLT